MHQAQDEDCSVREREKETLNTKEPEAMDWRGSTQQQRGLYGHGGELAEQSLMMDTGVL